MIKKTLVILFVGIFTSIVIPSESDNPQKNIFRNFPPELEDINDQTIPEDQIFTYDLQASDDDGDDLFFLPPGINGPAVGDIDDNDILTITPNPDYNGTIEVTITVSEGVDTDFDRFNLEVTPINDNPILNFINSVSFPEDGSGR